MLRYKLDFSKKFYKNSLKILYQTKSIKKELKCYDKTRIEIHETFEFKYHKEFKELIDKHEKTYEYVNSVDLEKYKKMELFINTRQKDLQRLLLKKNININGKKVNRAWIKLQELFHQTNFFKNKTSINAFFICEAPGNFVLSTQYYIKNYTDVKHFEWNAQSLVDADIRDQYGFMLKTRDHWDYGEDNSGDITKNLLYYYKKYQVDILIGDCGMKWGTKHENLGLYQLFYALLLVKPGGNFVIKTYAINYNLRFLSLLYIITCHYEKVYLFKSRRNIWSPEIYVVGVNHKGLDQKEITNLFKIYENKNLYPVKKIPDKFILEYLGHIDNFVNIYTNIKKLFVYFVKHPDKFNQEEIMKNIDKQNKNWLKKYLGK